MSAIVHAPAPVPAWPAPVPVWPAPVPAWPAPVPAWPAPSANGPLPSALGSLPVRLNVAWSQSRSIGRPSWPPRASCAAPGVRWRRWRSAKVGANVRLRPPRPAASCRHERGHLPVMGEWFALPLSEPALAEGGPPDLATARRLGKTIDTDLEPVR